MTERLLDFNALDRLRAADENAKAAQLQRSGARETGGAGRGQ